MKKVTLGGERLGNGKKIKVDLHGWGRSTFDQSRIWRSTMGVGMLIPCFNEVGLPGTTFDININTLGHTIPTISPLFGSFKLQIDMFACPIRLYQGVLHNNAVNIGLDMKDVLLPQIEIGIGNSNNENNKLSTTSLNNFLGIKGRTEEMYKFNALRHLAYYDIFKNYYSNKQEEYAKVIGNTRTNKILTEPQIAIETTSKDEPLIINDSSVGSENERRQINNTYGEGARITANNAIIQDKDTYNFDVSSNTITFGDPIPTRNNSGITTFYITSNFENVNLITFINTDGEEFQTDNTISTNIDDRRLIFDNLYRIIGIVYRLTKNRFKIQFNQAYEAGTLQSIQFNNYIDSYEIHDFELENIDEARRQILSKSNLNQRILLNEDLNFLPYSMNFEDNGEINSNEKEFQGLCLKTYQNDIFNCWLSSEYVEKINNLTSITTDSDGNFSIDAFILAKKVYNILNRIAINGGTYENWQESVYGEDAIRRQESPIYIGGTSAEITFEEVVATTSAENQALGSLGGKGIMTNKKGGNIIYKCDEPCILMGIVSITPRVDYHQGNNWFVTNIDNMDNLHKPGLDGIGFQDLIENNVVWSGSPNVSLAKQTAWIQYQTAVNEVFGQFALDDEENSLKHMVLRRNYETNSDGEIEDFTTYIDPTKYNYAFADNSLKAQNFWLQIGFDVKSRRKMAASEIPNL